MPQPSPSADSTAVVGSLPAVTAPDTVDVSGLYLVRTLVVDGDAATRDLLVEAVGNRGHHVSAARSLEDAAPSLLMLRHSLWTDSAAETAAALASATFYAAARSLAMPATLGPKRLPFSPLPRG